MNKVTLMGRLTKDPETRFAQSAKCVCSFTLAVNRRFAREGQPKADFINVVAWDKTAEFAGKYFTKGMQIAVIGRLQSRTWDDNDGKRHYVTEVVAEETYFADSKRESSGSNSTQRTYSESSAGSGDGFYPMDESDPDELPF